MGGPRLFLGAVCGVECLRWFDAVGYAGESEEKMRNYFAADHHRRGVCHDADVRITPCLIEWDFCDAQGREELLFHLPR